MNRQALYVARKVFLALLVYRQLLKPLCPVGFALFLLFPVIAAMAALRYVLAGMVTLFLPKRAEGAQTTAAEAAKRCLMALFPRGEAGGLRSRAVPDRV